MTKKKAFIDPESCDRSPFCPVSRVCPAQAITLQGSGFFGKMPTVDQDKCTGCGVCTRYCPHGAVRLK
ncbi:MAG: ATP-binding protein [Bacillota bacterium]